MAKLLLRLAGRDAPTAVDLRPAATPGAYYARIDATRPGSPAPHAPLTPEALVELASAGNGEGRLLVAGRVIPFFVHRDANAITVWLDGRTHRFERVALLRRGDDAAIARAASGELHAPMPGTILKVHVRPGDEVHADQPLVVMISMKMEMTLAAPMNAKVLSVACAEGQLVEMNAVLVKLAERSNVSPA